MIAVLNSVVCFSQIYPCTFQHPCKLLLSGPWCFWPLFTFSILKCSGCGCRSWVSGSSRCFRRVGGWRTSGPTHFTSRVTTPPFLECDNCKLDRPNHFTSRVTTPHFLDSLGSLFGSVGSSLGVVHSLGNQYVFGFGHACPRQTTSNHINFLNTTMPSYQDVQDGDHHDHSNGHKLPLRHGSRRGELSPGACQRHVIDGTCFCDTTINFLQKRI